MPTGTQCTWETPARVRSKDQQPRIFAPYWTISISRPDLGAEVVWLKSPDVLNAILEFGAGQEYHPGLWSGRTDPKLLKRIFSPVADESAAFPPRRISMFQVVAQETSIKDMSPTISPQVAFATARWRWLGGGRSLWARWPCPKCINWAGAIRRTLYRNYVSIEASQHMHAALWALELAETG